MGICNCQNKIDEGKIYLEFLESLKISQTKSEDLIKKLKEKYLTVLKEDKKKAALLNEIFPMCDSNILEFREFSQNYFFEYFEENKKKFYALCLFCDKDSNFKRSFEEITNTNKKEWSKNYSADKSQINKDFLAEIVLEYLRFSTIRTVPYIEKISGTDSTTKYLTPLFDEETTGSIVKDLFQPLEVNDEMIDLEMFFNSESFRKITNKAEVLKFFETYNALKKKS